MDYDEVADLFDEKTKRAVSATLRHAAANGVSRNQTLTILDPAHLTYLASLVDRDRTDALKRETSVSIALWAEETFGPATALSTAIRAQVELTELVTKLQRLAEGRCGEGAQVVLEGDVLEVMGEVADVRIVLARIQRFFHRAPTAEEAEDAKMVVNRRRRWRLDGCGHGQHVADEQTSSATDLPRRALQGDKAIRTVDDL